MTSWGCYWLPLGTTGAWTEAGFHAQCVMMLFAGHETTRNLIGNGLLTLLRNPAVLDEIRADVGLVRPAV